jgi:hypothetical protein
MSRHYSLPLRHADIGDIVPRHWQHDRLLIAVELTLPTFRRGLLGVNNEGRPSHAKQTLKKKPPEPGEATIDSLARRYKQIKPPC